jgi:hypothetical protein
MTPTGNALGFIVATLLMILAGMSKKRIEWKPRPRNDSRHRRLKPPRNAP